MEPTPHPPTDTPPDWADLAEARLLDAALPLAAALGWGEALVRRAGADIGLSPGEVALLLPHGARDLAALYARRGDGLALAALADVDPLNLKVRERITRAIAARVDAAAADPEVLRRWAGFLALPGNLPLALRLVWESADRIWRWAGDQATDENHYSKRAIVSGVLISTLSVRMSAGAEAAQAHLASRIEAVMAFEKWKAGVRPFALARETAAALGRIRYGG